MFILRFFFISFFLLFVLGILGILLFFRSIGNIKRQFDRMKTNRPYDNSSRGRQWSDEQQDKNAGTQSIRDNRSPSDRNKRIFSDTDGEYVDFEETK